MLFRGSVLFRMAAAALLLLQAVSPQTTQPLTLPQIEQLIAASTPEAVIRRLVTDRGIAFQAGEAQLTRLKEAGASEAVVEAVRQSPWRFTPARISSDGATGGALEMPTSFGVFRWRAAVIELEGQEPLSAAAARTGTVWYIEAPDGLLVSFERVEEGQGSARRLVKLGAKPLRILWESNLGKAAPESLLLTGDALYAGSGSWAGRLNTENGEWIWQYDLPPGTEGRFGQTRIEGRNVLFALRDSHESFTFGLADGIPVRIPGRFVRRINPKDGQIYVWIPPGRFRMGCSPGDDECYGGEKPTREVKIAEGFWMGESEVTQGAYEKAMGNNPSRFKGANLPVERVTWNEAGSYCEKAGGRLPTAAEWEYAARGRTVEARYEAPGKIAWYSGNSSGKTHEVKTKLANPYGLFDMLGNVWEWTSDDFAANKDVRGGSWDKASSTARVSSRFGVPSHDSDADLGFRCALPLPQPELSHDDLIRQLDEDVAVTAVKSLVNPNDGLTYVWIPPGKFQMGCSPGDNACSYDERPAREVRIVKGFWMGETEVPQGAYQRVMGNNPSIDKGDNRPVISVRWDDARTYCEKIGGRLPTAAEWEYAARAGTVGAQYGPLDEIAWHGLNSRWQWHEVKMKRANAYGLHDMLGNAWEWTSNELNGVKEVRGGSWYEPAPRVSDRVSGMDYMSVGFRCVTD